VSEYRDDQPIRALALNCTLKRSPTPSSTEALAEVVLEALRDDGVETEIVRVVDHTIHPGVSSEEGDGDQWPAIREKLLAADILLVATPTWLGQASSIAQRVMERMDAMLSETDEDGRPVAYNRVAGFVVTGNEDGAHHVISQLAQCVVDVGYTVPGQAWTYWNKGPGPGEEVYLTTEETDWSNRTGRTAAANLLGVARALRSKPLGPPRG